MDFDFTLILFIATATLGSVLLIHYLSQLVLVGRLFAPVIRLAQRDFAQAIVRLCKPIWGWLLDMARSLFIVLLVVFCIRTFIVEPFQIPSGSMKPTLEVGDFIVVNKLSYGARLPIANKRLVTWSDIERGDVVVFNFPGNEKMNFIKRVVGVPGDTVVYDGASLTVNGTKLTTTAASPQDDSGLYTFVEQNGDAQYHIYRNNKQPAKHTERRFEVPPDHYFVMGDNRDNSNDSRFWGFVPKELIQGKASFVWMHWQPFFSVPQFDKARSIE